LAMSAPPREPSAISGLDDLLPAAGLLYWKHSPWG
jgi:hypothetical protein